MKNTSLTEVLLSDSLSTVKGVWAPKILNHRHHENNFYHDYVDGSKPHYNGHNHGHNPHHGRHNQGHGHPGHHHGVEPLLKIDWLDTPDNQTNNAFIIDLGAHGKVYNHYLDAIIKSGDIVVFGPQSRVIRYIPKSYREAVGTIEVEIDEGTITQDKLDEELSSKIDSALQEVQTENSRTVWITGNGANEPIKADIVISEYENNIIRDKEGLHVHNTELTFEPLTRRLTFTDNTGARFDVDLGSLVIDPGMGDEDDRYVTTARLSGDNVLTLERQGGLNNIDIDLEPLKATQVTETNTVVLEGNGTNNDKIKATVKLAPDNAIEETAAGLKVSKDLSQYDNTIADFAKKSDIGNAEITLQGFEGIDVNAVIGLNEKANRTIQIKLDQTVQNTLDKANEAHSWGNHADVGYVTQNTEYIAGDGINVDGEVISVFIDQNPDNILSIEDGLFQKNSKLYFKPGTHELVFIDNKGSQNTLDLSALTTDLHVNNAVLSGNQLVLTVDGGQTVQVNLDDLTKSQTLDSNTIEFGGTGQQTDKLTANVRVSNTQDNTLEVTPRGLKVTKDLAKYDNSRTGFITEDQIGDAELRIRGNYGIEATGSFRANAVTDEEIEISLNEETILSLAKGVAAYNFGDHAEEGYVKTDTIYTASEGVILDGNDIQVHIDQNPENILKIEDGLFQKNSKLYFKSSTHELVFIDNRGNETNLDLSALTTDLHVHSAELDGNQLTLVVDGGQAVQVNLESLTKSATQNSNSIEFSGTGQQTDKLTANVLLADNNAIEHTVNGLKVSKDLSKFDNSNTDFATRSEIGSGDLSITGEDGIAGNGVFNANSQGDVNVSLKLSAETKDNIQKGVLAESWGNHANANYLKEAEFHSTNTTEVYGKGTPDDKLAVSVKVVDGSALEATPNGLKVSKDLAQYDNTNTDFATRDEIGNAELTISGIHGIDADGSFTANSKDNSTVNIGLSSDTRQDIQKGILAESWGDHAAVGYVTEDTTYQAGENIEIIGTEIDVKLNDAHSDNAIIKDGGLYTKNAHMSYDPDSKKLTFVDNKGQVSVLNLGALAHDIYVNGGEVQGDNLILTFENDGQPLSINLSEISKITDTTDTNTIGIRGNGSYGNALNASVRVSEAGGNLIDVKGDGLFVSSDLNLYDNSIAKFAKVDEIGNAKLQLLGGDDIQVRFDNVGQDSFRANAFDDEVVHFSLQEEIKAAIQDGLEAHSWGNHADAGYAQADGLNLSEYVRYDDLKNAVIDILSQLEFIGAPDL